MRSTEERQRLHAGPGDARRRYRGGRQSAGEGWPRLGVQASSPSTYRRTSTSSRFASIAASTRSTVFARFSASRATRSHRRMPVCTQVRRTPENTVKLQPVRQPDKHATNYSSTRCAASPFASKRTAPCTATSCRGGGRKVGHLSRPPCAHVGSGKKDSTCYCNSCSSSTN